MSTKKKYQKSRKDKRSEPEQPDPAIQWRQKALAMFPYLHRFTHELEEDEFTVGMFFFELLPLCASAHRSGSEWELQRIYDFAEWCWRQDTQGEEDLSNAVGVAFYEHLSEHVPLSEIVKWIKPDIYDQLSELFESTFTDRVK